MAHTAAHRARHPGGEEEGDQQGREDERRVDDGVAAGVVGDAARAGERCVGEMDLDAPVGVEVERGGGEERLGGDALGGQPRGRLPVGDLADHLVHAGWRDVGPARRPGVGGSIGAPLFTPLPRVGQRLAQPCHVLGGAGARVLLERHGFEVGVRAEGRELRLEFTGGEGAAVLDQQMSADGAGQGLGRLGQGDGVERPAEAGLVGAAEAQLVRHLHQGVLEQVVALLRPHSGQA